MFQYCKVYSHLIVQPISIIYNLVKLKLYLLNNNPLSSQILAIVILLVFLQIRLLQMSSVSEIIMFSFCDWLISFYSQSSPYYSLFKLSEFLR